MGDLPPASAIFLLPPELVLLIAGFLDYWSEINALSRVSHRFYDLLNPVLYRRISHTDVSYVFQWAADTDLEATARKCLHAGLTPTLDVVKTAIRRGHGQMVELLCEELALNREGNNETSRLSALATLLGVAAEHGRMPIARLLVSYGANLQTENGCCSAFVDVAAREDLQMAQLLVEAGASMNTLGDHALGPLDGAAQTGNMQMVKYLLEHGADPDFSLGGLLTSSLQFSHLGVARVLLDHGAQPSIRMLAGAVSYERSSAIELLLRHLDYNPGELDATNQTILACAAASFGLIEILTTLIDHGWEANCQPIDEFGSEDGPSTPLAWAARHGQEGAVRFLISHGANPAGSPPDFEEGFAMSPLTCAVRNGHEETVRILLESQTSVPQMYSRDPFLACPIESKTIFQLLLDHKVPLWSEPLCEIFSWETPEHVQMLLDSGYNIIDDPSFFDDGSSLLELVAYCPKETLDVLVKHGFDPRPENDDDEKSALCNAAETSNSNLLQFFMSHGFNIQRPKWQASLLQHAASGWDDTRAAETVNFLLKKGLDIEALDEDHMTPLLLAISAGDHFSAVEVLLACGANPCYEAPSGECPLTAVMGHGCTNSSVRALLEGIEKRDDIPFSVLGLQLLRAIPNIVEDEWAPFNEKKKMLTQFYWRRKYPVPQ